MRYFFISYEAKNNTKIATGNLTLDCNIFPSNSILRQEASKKSGFPIPEIIITGLFEFANQQDFESFVGTDYDGT